jgi:hypothetical protein
MKYWMMAWCWIFWALLMGFCSDYVAKAAPEGYDRGSVREAAMAAFTGIAVTMQIVVLTTLILLQKGGNAASQKKKDQVKLMDDYLTQREKEARNNAWEMGKPYCDGQGTTWPPPFVESESEINLDIYDY